MGSYYENRVLRRSNIYYKAEKESNSVFLMENASQHGFPPYILVANGDPILAWLIMVLSKDNLQGMLYSLYCIHHKMNMTVVKHTSRRFFK